MHMSCVDGYTGVLLCTFLMWMDMLRLLTSELIVHMSGVDGYVETLNQ